MAYRFNGSSDYVEFSKAPFTGNTFGPLTMAMLMKRSATANYDYLIDFANASLSDLFIWMITSSNNMQLYTPSGGDSTFSLTSTSVWYLLAVTRAASSTPRFHVWDGTTWSHQAVASGGASSYTVGGTDRLLVGGTSGSGAPLGGDVVCAGIKKTDTADATVETLSPTAFSAWRSFGFDWLIGFDTSLQAAGVLQDQATPGTGDEVAKTGTSVVSDPSGWAWVSSVTPVANFTGTPTSGTASLSVAFTDSSTNTPTSWAWTFGDGGTSTSQNPTHSYTTSGVYTVTLVATNASGSDTKTRTGYVTVAENINYATGGGIEIW